jgi:predicted ATPase/DNA-binding SARP family transcriptional activator
MTVRLVLFGSPTIHYGGTCFALPFERRSQLLAFLALRRTWVARNELATLLWPDQESRLAYTNLRKTLFRLQALQWAARIESQGGALRFEVPTDVLEFESALREGRIGDALPLRTGELLPGFEDDQSEAWSTWLAFERGRLRLAWRDAALERLGADIVAAEAIDLSARLLDADPLDEAALRAHMTWLARGGQGARARQAYRDYAQRLARDLGLSAGPELQALHDSLGSAAASSMPRPAPSHVPAVRDAAFVGRTVELRRIASLLAQDDCRLLCLIGPGGAGKTRLAERAMQDLAPRYPDGAAFIPLEDIGSPGEVGARLARELELALTGSADPLEQVIAFLREREMLLVLDNFEHLAAHASILERVTRACRRVRMIVTSRVRPAVSAEWLLPVDGLPCPEPEDQDRAEAFDAVRLFIQAARRVQPALVPGDEAASIVDICRQLEGLPLALELAAAWTRVLSCDVIAAELRNGTELLHAVDDTRPARHASIDVVFERSWQLLGAQERDALARLSVFRGGFSAEAARTVASASLPVLGALVDKSLLRKGETRIFMHPLVQQLAAVRLGDGDARAAAERAHALHFHHRLDHLRRGVEDGDRDALQWVDTEFENCRIAWRWAVAHGGPDALLRSTPTLLHFCDHRGRLEDGLSLLRDAIGAEAVEAHASLRARLLAAAAHLEYRLDRYADAEATATRALAAARSRRDHDAKLQSLKVLGGCSLRLGRHADAKRFFGQALAQAPASVDPSNAAAMLDNLALVEKATGNYDEALRLSLRSLVEHRRLGDVAGEALCLNNLGALHLDMQDCESAGAHLREGLVVCDRHGLVSTRLLILANLAELAVKTGDQQSAETYGRRALDLADAAGNRAITCWMKLQFVRLALRRGDWAAARSDLAASLGIAISVARPALQLAGVSCFAELLDAQGEADCARRIFAFAAEHALTSAAESAEIRARLASMPPPAAPGAPWPGLALDELAHRIVVESSVAHAPLIAALRGDQR